MGAIDRQCIKGEMGGIHTLRKEDEGRQVARQDPQRWPQASASFFAGRSDWEESSTTAALPVQVYPHGKQLHKLLICTNPIAHLAVDDSVEEMDEMGGCHHAHRPGQVVVMT